jgi:hypothetical protein
MRSEITFREAVNWRYVRNHFSVGNEPVKPGALCRRVIEHPRANGYRGVITERGGVPHHQPEPVVSVSCNHVSASVFQSSYYGVVAT